LEQPGGPQSTVEKKSAMPVGGTGMAPRRDPISGGEAIEGDHAAADRAEIPHANQTQSGCYRFHRSAAGRRSAIAPANPAAESRAMNG